MESHGFIPYLRVAKDSSTFNHYPDPLASFRSKTPCARKAKMAQKLSSHDRVMAILGQLSYVAPNVVQHNADEASPIEGVQGEGEDVPPPPPKPEGARIKRIGRDIPLEHLLDHTPMLPHCKECQMGKAQRMGAYRTHKTKDDKATCFGQRIR